MLCVICLLSDSIKCKFLMGRKTNFFFFLLYLQHLEAIFWHIISSTFYLLRKNTWISTVPTLTFLFAPARCLYYLRLPAPGLLCLGFGYYYYFFLDGPRADFWATYVLFLLVLVGFLLVSAQCMFSDLSLQVHGFSFDSDLFCLSCFSRLLDPCCSFWCFKLQWWLVFGPVAGSGV